MWAAAWAITKLIPWQAWFALGVVVFILYGVYRVDSNGYERGRKEVQALCDEDNVKAAAEIARIKAEQAKVVEREVIVYRDRIKIVRERGDEIIRNVEVIVPDALLSGGFRVLHDAAVDGKLPDDPIRAAGEAPGVEAATAARVIAENYAACHANAEQLEALQRIVSQ